MINDSNEKSKNNFLKDYIEHFFNKERNKFSKLKYNLFTMKNSKKSLNRVSDQIKEVYQKENLPYINKQFPIKDKEQHVKSSKIINSIIEEKRNLRNNNFISNNFKSSKISNSNQNKAIRKFRFSETSAIKDKIELIDIKNFKDESNLYSNQQSENKMINISQNNNTETKDKKKVKIKRAVSSTKINSKTTNKNYFKNLREELNKEIVIYDRDKFGNVIKKNIMNNTDDSIEINEIIRKNRYKARSKKEKEENKIIDRLYIGNHVINNCKIKNMTVYDIRPLNKTKQKASCHFSMTENSFAPRKLHSKKFKIANLMLKINPNSNTNSLTRKNLKYFRNSYSQVMSNKSKTLNNNNTSHMKKEKLKNKGKEKEKEKSKENNNSPNKNQYSSYVELSEKDLIRKLNINSKDQFSSKKISNLLAKSIKRLSNEKVFAKTKYFGSTKKRHNNKELEYIDLSILARETSENKRSKKNLRTFMNKEGGDVIRGEKIKFLKTCYQIKFVKPIFSQQSFKYNSLENSKKEIFALKIKKFPVNHYKLDKLSRINKNQINITESNLYDLKNNINSQLTTLLENIEREFKDN